MSLPIVLGHCDRRRYIREGTAQNLGFLPPRQTSSYALRKLKNSIVRFTFVTPRGAYQRKRSVQFSISEEYEDVEIGDDLCGELCQFGRVLWNGLAFGHTHGRRRLVSRVERPPRFRTFRPTPRSSLAEQRTRKTSPLDIREASSTSVENISK